MLDKKYKKLFTESEGFFLLLWFILLIIMTLGFIEECIKHQSIIIILTYLIWIIASLGFSFLSWRKLFILEKTEEFSQASQKTELPEIIAIGVVLVPVIVLFIIIFTNNDFTKSYIVENPKFDILGNWANILLGLGFIFQTLAEIVESQKKIIKRILGLFQTIAILSGFIFYMIYSSHLSTYTQ